MLQTINLDTIAGIEKYESLLLGLDTSEPFFLKEFIDIFSNGTKNLICFYFVSSKKDVFAIMPGYLNPIAIGGENTHYYEFITPYGYTGPIFSKNTSDIDIKEFWKSIDKWYNDNNVVTEFIRFNLFGNEEHYSGKIFTTLLNIKGHILEEEDQWIAFNRKVRKNVNKAKRENLYSNVYFLDITDDNVSEFHDIYTHTMKRTSAKETFLYSLNDFRRFLNLNKNHAAICTVYFEDTPVSSELLLISQDAIYSFLGGTDERYFDKRPNDFLKVEALNWARSVGKRYYVLGGGYGLQDGIFQYKKGFFPNDVVYYYTGRKILNKGIYDQLVTKASNYRLTKGLDVLNTENDTFFPLYNKGG